MARGPAEESEDPRLSLALSLASEAGRLAVAGRPDLDVQWKGRWKGPGDRVTTAELRIPSGCITTPAGRPFFPFDVAGHRRGADLR